MSFSLIKEGLDVSQVLQELVVNWDVWPLLTVRQDFDGSPHKDTECIYLRGPHAFSFDDVQESLASIDTPVCGDFPETMKLIQEVLNCTDYVRLGRVLIVKLKPGGAITPHKDEGLYARYYSRFHIPITSDEGNIFICDGQAVHMRVGEAWFFNHQEEHEVYNNSDTDRIHIIVDVRLPDGGNSLWHSQQLLL